MAIIVDIVPPELLARTFVFLPAERKNISACRLVCGTFKVLSSPFLHTRIVLSERMEAVINFHEVLHHPNFSWHIMELVYYASMYSARITNG